MVNKTQQKNQEPSAYAQLVDFAKKSRRFIEKCNKPNKNDYMKSVLATASGVVACGFAGYLIKTISVPITSFLVSK